MEFTEEEQREIENTFKLFKDYAVNPESTDEVKNAIMSFSLSMYSLSVARLGIQSKETNLQKAVSSIEKAYSIYQLPLYLYDLACFLEQKGKLEEANEMYMKFLNTQMNYNIRPIDKVILAQRDLEESIKVARSKTL